MGGKLIDSSRIHWLCLWGHLLQWMYVDMGANKRARIWLHWDTHIRIFWSELEIRTGRRAKLVLGEANWALHSYVAITVAANELILYKLLQNSLYELFFNYIESGHFLFYNLTKNTNNDFFLHWSSLCLLLLFSRV